MNSAYNFEVQYTQVATNFMINMNTQSGTFVGRSSVHRLSNDFHGIGSRGNPAVFLKALREIPIPGNPEIVGILASN